MGSWARHSNHISFCAFCRYFASPETRFHVLEMFVCLYRATFHTSCTVSKFLHAPKAQVNNQYLQPPLFPPPPLSGAPPALPGCLILHLQPVFYTVELLSCLPVKIEHSSLDECLDCTCILALAWLGGIRKERDF